MKMPKAGAEAVELFQTLVPPGPDVSVRKMFGHPAAFLRGNMFLGVFGDSIFLRLSPVDIEAAKKVAGVRPFEPMPGRRMGGYLVFPDAVLRDPKRVGPWLAKSRAAALALPAKLPKPRRA